MNRSDCGQLRLEVGRSLYPPPVDPTLWVAVITVLGASGGSYLASLLGHRFAFRQESRRAAVEEFDRAIALVTSDNIRERTLGWLLIRSAMMDARAPDARVQRRFIALWSSRLELEALDYNQGDEFSVSNDQPEVD